MMFRYVKQRSILPGFGQGLGLNVLLGLSLYRAVSSR